MLIATHCTELGGIKAVFLRLATKCTYRNDNFLSFLKFYCINARKRLSSSKRLCMGADFGKFCIKPCKCDKAAA